MPRSTVIYISREAFSHLQDTIRNRFQNYPLKPYTFSFPQRTETDKVRVRITGLAEDAILSDLSAVAESEGARLASEADRDVRNRTYEELIEDADRTRRVVTIQLLSPTIVEIAGRSTPFPIISAVFRRYTDVWNAFSEKKITTTADVVSRIHVADFRISCMTSPFGVGSQGWITLEMEKGRTEEEIALFNALVDFAFFCGTGLHTDEGLGQTRRAEGEKLRRAEAKKMRR